MALSTAADMVASRMRAVNPMRSRRRAIDDLRLAVACLPRETRVAMLEGMAGNPIIAGAYSTRDGICPMLAAHRAGGRTNFIAFAEAWDRFAGRTSRLRRARRATERELLVLRAHLEASLLEDEGAPAGGLAQVIAEHRALVERRRRRPGDRVDPAVLGERPPRRPGDRDRARELRDAPGWAWTQLFRRYEDYAEVVNASSQEGDPVVAGRPSPV